MSAVGSPVLWPWVGTAQEMEAALDFSEIRVPETTFLLRPCPCRAGPCRAVPRCF